MNKLIVRLPKMNIPLRHWMKFHDLVLNHKNVLVNAFENTAQNTLYFKAVNLLLSAIQNEKVFQMFACK